MNTNCDYVLVKIDKELNDHLATITNENGEKVELLLNPNFNPTHHAKICAEVIGAPGYLSGRDYPLHERYPGTPRPLAYRGHDSISATMRALPLKYQKLQESALRASYQPGTYEVEMISHYGVEVECEIGDTVYFHYNCLLTDTNFWGYTEDYQLIYRIHYSQMFCYVRDGVIHMINNYVLVSEYFDGDIEDIDVNGVLIKAKLKGNLVIQIHEKPKYLLGRMEHIGPGIGPYLRSENLRGEVILYAIGSEFENTIEGVKYLVMRHQDIVAVYCDEKFTNLSAGMDFNTLRPVGDYMMVIPDAVKVSEKTNTHVWDQTKENQEFKQGELFVLPHMVSQTKKNKKWSTGNVIGQGELVPSDWIGGKIAYEKSSFYLYTKEWERGFIRYGDVYGHFENGVVEL